MSGIEQASGEMARLHRHARVLAALAAMLFVAPAVAQTAAPGWILIVRIVPNPMAIGHCAGITVEPQDDEGYRRNELSNGGAIDFHKFRYDADTTNFQWQNGEPMNGVLCARAGAPPSSVTVTVTLPDGLSGSAQLTSIAAGQSAAAVQYAKQGPLRRPGVPPPHPSTSTVAATATDVGAGSANTSGGGGGSAPTRTPEATSKSTTPGITTTTALSMTGAYAAMQPLSVTTAALTMVGSYAASQPMTVETTLLSMTGDYSAVPAQVVTTSAMSITGGFAASSLSVTTPALSMVGNYAAVPPQTVVTPALTMTGNAGP